MSYQPALVLLSGGLDSVTVLAWARRQGYAIQTALSFSYGQRHVREIQAARSIAEHYQIPHEIITLPTIGGSALTNPASSLHERALPTLNQQIASTYVPNRNMILIAHAAARALLGDARYLIGGWNNADGANYPDCRDEFLAAAEQTLRLATLRDFSIVRPLIHDDKAEIVRRALELHAPVEQTWTCYAGGEYACGACDACRLRVAAFRAAGVIDPLPYEIELDWRGCEPYARVSE